MNRLLRVLALSAVALPLAIARTPAQSRTGAFDLEEASVTDLQQRMASGRETARSLVEKYSARIEAIDRNGPALRSVIELNPDAIEIADRLDTERKAGRTRGPLHVDRDAGIAWHRPR